MYPIFVTIDQFLHDFQPKQTLKETDRQILNCRMTTLLTKVPPEKEDLSNKNKKQKNENRNICSKIIDEQTLYIYIYIML